MKNRGIRQIVIGAVILATSAWIWAAEPYRVVSGPKHFYYGHISYIESGLEEANATVLREGKMEPEQAVINLPVGPGDTVRTSTDRRCEIQFDTGTVVRLDFNTSVRIETILARSLSSLEQISALTLDRGRIYVMYKQYGRTEMFQVLTPKAAVKMKHNSVALIAASADGTTETQVRYGRAQVLFGSDEGLLEDRTVRKGERLIVLEDNQSELAAAIDGTAFELWNKDVNAHFEDLHEGVSALPKPVQNLPPAVFYFAQTYGYLYGEWLWDDFYGYVWRPYRNDLAYPWGWQPYYYGRWAYASGQMYWVPEEPWGWIPYHLGVWQWDKKHGWVWLPGSLFSPAWVTWDFYFGYACWRPWSLYDWIYDGMYGGSNPFYWRTGFFYTGGAWGYTPYGYWTRGTGQNVEGEAVPQAGLTVVRRDHLKQPAANPYPVPSELRSVVRKVTAAYESGDPRIRAAIEEAQRQLVFVPKGDLRAPAVHEKALRWDQVPKSDAPSSRSGEAAAERRSLDPRHEAVRHFRGIDGPSAIPQRRDAPPVNRPAVKDPAPVGSRPEGAAGPARRADGSAVRFRDWNPDLRVARELGVRIEYSSARNEIRCPELRISSKDREVSPRFVRRLTSYGVETGMAYPTGLGDRGPSGSSDSEGSAASSGTSKTGRTSDRTETKESKGSEGGKIKN